MQPEGSFLCSLQMTLPQDPLLIWLNLAYSRTLCFCETQFNTEYGSLLGLAPCSLEVDRRFRLPYCLYHQGDQ
jgi:hypothetical protein